MSLYEKYFEDPLKEDHKVDTEVAERWGRIREFVTRDAYKDFRKELTGMVKQTKPQPGTEAAMLYQIGVRDGLESVEDLLDRWEEIAREQRYE